MQSDDQRSQNEPDSSPSELSSESETAKSWNSLSSTSTIHTKVVHGKTLLGFGPSTSAHPRNAVNDPFDYEQKYTPDEEFEEMSSKARVFRVYGDEAGKHDLEIVGGWREGLDMLLVFAALFSAVVTTFVISTCQFLRVDNGEVGNKLMLEMIDVQRAILHVMTHGPDTVNDVPRMDISFHPKTGDLWVNGLWFTSLALSLTTTLLAVLAKQWIHQYITMPSVGSPRNRCRLRHFRYMALEKWHVPLIIELLPVLLHTAMGLFFVGLVAYLFALSRAIAAALAIIGGGAFVVYAITNALPIFFPDCAYKTPLSTHFFSLICFVRRWIASLYSADRAKASLSPRSLQDIELETVQRQGRTIDALALAWLFNVSSNLSVQSVVLQAMSSLPLESIPIITKAIASVVKAINDHFYPDQPLDRFERFQRAALRLVHQTSASKSEDLVIATSDEDSKYILFRDPLAAIHLIHDNLLGLVEPEHEFDAVLWGKIFSNALSCGTDWLNIDYEEPSRVWSDLLRSVVNLHECENCDCDKKRQPLVTFPLEESMPSLWIDKQDLATTGKSRNLTSALANNMLPSFLEWILSVGFPHAKRSPDDFTMNLPNDVFLFLVMLQTPSIQKTSSLHSVWVGNNPTLLRERPVSLFRRILNIVGGYPRDRQIPTHDKEDVAKATLTALQNVLRSELFGCSKTIILEDEAFVVRNIFEGLNWRLRLSGAQDHQFDWLTPELLDKVLEVAFKDSKDSTLLVGNILSYLLCSSEHSRAVELVYTRLLQCGWLQGLAVNLKHGWTWRRLHPDVPTLHLWRTHYTGFLGALYIDGLASLASHAPAVYKDVVDDLCGEANLSTMCKVLLLSDISTQSKLWKLAKIVKDGPWTQCSNELVAFSTTKEAQKMYTKHFHQPSIGIGANMINNLPIDTFHTVADAFAKDLRGARYDPPNYSSNELSAASVEFAQWWKNNGRVHHDIY